MIHIAWGTANKTAEQSSRAPRSGFICTALLSQACSVWQQMPQRSNIDPANRCLHKRRMETRAPRTGLFSLRHLAGLVLLCALLLRGMIPGGYMPNVDAADGQGFLVICSSIGERVVSVDGNGAAPADTHQEGLCAFALLPVSTPLLLLTVLLLWLPPRAVRRPLPPVLRHLRQIICLPPEARAPPAFA